MDIIFSYIWDKLKNTNLILRIIVGSIMLLISMVVLYEEIRIFIISYIAR